MQVCKPVFRLLLMKLNESGDNSTQTETVINVHTPIPGRFWYNAVIYKSWLLNNLLGSWFSHKILNSHDNQVYFCIYMYLNTVTVSYLDYKPSMLIRDTIPFLCILVIECMQPICRIFYMYLKLPHCPWWATFLTHLLLSGPFNSWGSIIPARMYNNILKGLFRLATFTSECLIKLLPTL